MQQLIFIPCPQHPLSQYDAFINMNPACPADRRINCQYCFHENIHNQQDFIRSDHFTEAYLNTMITHKQVKYQQYDQVYKNIQSMIKEFIEKINKKIEELEIQIQKLRGQVEIFNSIQNEMPKVEELLNNAPLIASFKEAQKSNQVASPIWTQFRLDLDNKIKEIHKADIGPIADKYKTIKNKKNQMYDIIILSEFYDQEVLDPYLRTSSQVTPILQFPQTDQKYLLTKLCTIQCQNLIQAKLGNQIQLGRFIKIYAADYKILLNQAMDGLDDSASAQSQVKQKIEKEIWQCIANQKNTLFLMKLKHGQIGAYTPIRWNLSGWTYEQDPNLETFIFSVTREEIYPLKQAQSDFAIYPSRRYLPCFGQKDLVIKRDLMVESILGDCYDASQYGRICRKKHLLSLKTDQIVDIEIHQYQRE